MSGKDFLNEIRIICASNRTRLVDFNTENQILVCYDESKEEYGVFNVVIDSNGSSLINGSYVTSLKEAGAAMEAKMGINPVLDSTESIERKIKKEINTISREIEGLENRIEKLNDLIKSFSPNLFGENGLKDELSVLIQKRDAFIENGDLLNAQETQEEINIFKKPLVQFVDIDIEKLDSVQIIEHAKEFMLKTQEDMDNFKEKLNNCIEKLQEIDYTVCKSLFSKEEIESTLKVGVENPLGFK